jgi:hypothetical protein
MAAAVEVKGRVTFDGLIERLQEILEEDGDVADIDAIKEAMDSYVVLLSSFTLSPPSLSSHCHV